MTIHPLAPSDWRILKNITITVPQRNGSQETAHVLYLRPFSDTYRMHSPETIDEKEKFHRCLTGTPEEEFPRDILDRVIEAGLKQVFPNATVSTRSSHVITNFELENLQKRVTLYGTPRQVTLQIEPDIDALVPRIQTFSTIRLFMELYPDTPGSNNWQDEFQTVTLTAPFWKAFNDAYTAGLLQKTNVSKITS